MNLTRKSIIVYDLAGIGPTSILVYDVELL